MAVTIPTTAGNDPVDITSEELIERVQDAIRGALSIGYAGDHHITARLAAIATIRALESSGIRLMQREATEEMIQAARLAHHDYDGKDFPGDETYCQMEAALTASWSAAITYGTPPYGKR